MSELERGFAEWLPKTRLYEPPNPPEVNPKKTFTPYAEWKDIIHLMNEQAREIAKKAPAEVNDSERQYLLMTLEANRNAFCSGLYAAD